MSPILAETVDVGGGGLVGLAVLILVVLLIVYVIRKL